ncbi:PAS domain-containing sensor histidine kinase [Spirosoma radiotolerans]|uniref:PAS domain-containing sensor histidine kinase n=1 Tax=Spirosoma radiotolerans TaxID=1379870 RepID=UPI001D10778D|nr:PAS domain S-box protein [Spirosoma radiotolerans]
MDEQILALQKELQRVKQQTASALEAVGIGLWVMYPDQRIITWDEQCQKIYGWPQATVSLDELFRQLHPQDLVHLRALVADPPSRKTQKPTTVDYRITSPVDGIMRWIRITGRVATHPSGPGDCFSGTAQNITDEKRKEATLKTIEQRFQLAFMNASVGVVILDTESNIQLINKSFANLVGYSQDELLDRHFGTISHPDDVEENVALVQQLIRGESNSYVFNKRYLHKDGTIVWGQVSSALIRDQEGKPDSFISIVQNITAELQAQAEQKKLVSLLKTSEERLQDAIELAELSTFEICPGDGTILLSGRAKGWLGFKPAETPSLDQVLNTIRDRDSVEAVLGQTVADGIGTAMDIEFWAVNQQTGQERLYHAQGRVVRSSPDNTALSIRGIAKDITAQRQYAQDLEQQVQGRTQALQRANLLIKTQADQLRFVTDSSLTAIALYAIVRDEATGDVVDLRYELINQMAQRMTGRQASDLLGHTMLEVFPGMKENSIWERYIELAQTGVPLRYYNHYTQDGYDIWYQVQGVRQGELLVLSFLDITELKQTQFQLESLNKDLLEANNNLEQFAFVASHDLQEPLRKIQSFGTLLLEQYAERLGDGADLILRMQVAAERMSILIKDLLTLSRITTQHHSLVEIPLSRVIQRVIDDLDIVIEEAEASLHIEPLPSVKGDESQLRQLFQNLLSNAVKFRKPGVELQVQISARLVAKADLPATVKPTRQATHYHQICIEDNGIGFDEMYLDRIFQVFQRLHTRSQYAGTGIGLAIVQKVAANHGGAITAMSQPGQGAAFFVYLPI